MAAAAAAVLALGAQDAHLLRLGVVAALWAALLAAFTTARARREISSRAEHADQLRAAYQLELQREVVARREHALTVERAIREQAQLSQQREIGQLRAELAAIGGNLARLAAAAPTSTLAIASAVPSTTATTSVTATITTPAIAPAARLTTTARDSLAGPELGFGPGRAQTSAWAAAPCPTDRHISNGESLKGGVPNGQGRHGVPSRQRLGSNNGNGSHHNGNGSHHNGNGARQAPADTPTAAGTQRTVGDLLAAHGVAAVPRRRHVHKDTRTA